jgi:hypothetical protein
LKNAQKILKWGRFSAASAFLLQQVSDQMIHCRGNIKTLNVNIVYGYKSIKARAWVHHAGQNNTVVGQQKLSLLYKVFLDVIFEYTVSTEVYQHICNRLRV